MTIQATAKPWTYKQLQSHVHTSNYKAIYPSNNYKAITIQATTMSMPYKELQSHEHARSYIAMAIQATTQP